MNKVITTILCVIVIFSAIFVGVRYNEDTKKEEQQNEIHNMTEVSNKVTDECTEEWEQLQDAAKLEILQANSNDIKVSPNCEIILKRYYKDCEHTTQEYSKSSEELTNKTEDEIKEIYSEWQVETFTSNKIVLYRELDGTCNEHYILKEKEGKIVVYAVDEKGEEEQNMQTDIATEYLTETDKINLANGWKIYGKENLNQLIEDFE